MPLRVCVVSVKDVEGITHRVDVQADSLFEAAASAVAIFQQQAWAAHALTPNAVLRVQVQLPAVVHDVPLKAVKRWVDAASVSPKEELVKKRVR